MEQAECVIAIYSRKSKFTGKGESIGNQVELCRQYIRNLYGEEAADGCETFEDEGFSGGNLQRPDFQNMMAQVRKGRFRAIVVYRLDRISRNISDFTGLIDELTKLGVAFVSIREQFDTSTPMGRAMMFIISVFSQLERETIAQRIRDNMRELAKTGRWLGGNTPMGFRSGQTEKVSVDGKVRRSCMLVPVPEEIKVPILIFDLYARTDSLTAVEAELLRRRIKTRQGKDFTRFAIRGILTNPVYMTADREAYRYFLAREAEICSHEGRFDGSCGIMAYNRTDQQKGRATRLLPVSEWIIAPGRHPGFIPSAQWIRVQESLERNKIKGYRKPRTNEALLTGLLYCACGERMYPKMSGRITADGRKSFSYVCGIKRRSKGERCGKPNADGIWLDDAVMEEIKGLPETRDILARQLRKHSGFEGGTEDKRSVISGLRAESEKNERVIKGLVDALAMTENGYARARILERMEELSGTNSEITNSIRELEGLEAQEAAGGLNDEAMKTLAENLSSFAFCVDSMDIRQRRETVRALVSGVKWDGKTVRVTLWGEDSK